jgi:hypothetical protein
MGFENSAGLVVFLKHFAIWTIDLIHASSW